MPNQFHALVGGTFDPIHNGHILPVKQVCAANKINRITYIPCHVSPHKHSPNASASARLTLCRLALEDWPEAEVSDWEIKQQGKSYSLHTLEHYAKLSGNHQLLFFIGMDSLLSLPTWYQWESLLKLTAFVVCSRQTELSDKTVSQLPQTIQARISRVPAELPQSIANGDIVLVDTDPVDVSSTKLRQQLGANADARTLAHLPEPVAQYIHSHQLYAGYE